MPGPVVGEIVDSQLAGAAGPLAWRLYRPDVVSGAGPRAEMAQALRGFFKATVPA